MPTTRRKVASHSSRVSVSALRDGSTPISASRPATSSGASPDARATEVRSCLRRSWKTASTKRKNASRSGSWIAGRGRTSISTRAEVTRGGGSNASGGSSKAIRGSLNVWTATVARLQPSTPHHRLATSRWTTRLSRLGRGSRPSRWGTRAPVR